MKKNNVMLILLAIISVGLLVSTLMLAQKNNDLKKDPDYIKVKKMRKNASLRKKVAKLINIPKNEKAFVGTYDSKTSLKDNPFFKEAKNGDKYLIFSESGKAIIYRESENKLINVGPIAITSQKNSAKDSSKELKNNSKTE